MSRKWNIVSRIQSDADGMQWCPDCGCALQDERSQIHLNMFHAFIKHCFDKWPEDLEPFPESREHLRAWLLVKVKHREPHHVFPLRTEKERRFAIDLFKEEMRVDRARGEFGFPAEVKVKDGAGFTKGVTILRPASIAIYGAKKISEKKFCEVSENVFNFVAEYAGINFDDWKAGLDGRKSTAMENDRK